MIMKTTIPGILAVAALIAVAEPTNAQRRMRALVSNEELGAAESMSLSNMEAIAMMEGGAVAKSNTGGSKSNKGGSKSNKSGAKSSKSTADSSFVFAMTNAADGNEIVMYTRNTSTGQITYPRHFSAGGVGGPDSTVFGSNPSDPLASQNALVVSGECLLAVNAGSDTVTSFQILSDRIELASVVGSGGNTPVSIAAQNGLVYVLNAAGLGSIKGFNIDASNCQLVPINNAIVSLNQAPLPPPTGEDPNPPFFASSPAQVGFTPDGSELVVTIKGVDGFPVAGGTINRFEIDDSGLLGEINVFETGSSSLLPFSFDFDNNGRLLVVDVFTSEFGGATGAVTMYDLNGSLTPLANTEVDGSLACWIKFNDGCAYTTNNGGNSISAIRVGDSSLELVNSEAQLNVPTDVQLTGDGRYLYALSTGFTSEDMQPMIYVFERNSDCTLEEIQIIGDGLPNIDTSVFGVAGLAIF